MQNCEWGQENSSTTDLMISHSTRSPEYIELPMLGVCSVCHMAGRMLSDSCGEKSSKFIHVLGKIHFLLPGWYSFLLASSKGHTHLLKTTTCHFLPHVAPLQVKESSSHALNVWLSCKLEKSLLDWSRYLTWLWDYPTYIFTAPTWEMVVKRWQSLDSRYLNSHGIDFPLTMSLLWYHCLQLVSKTPPWVKQMLLGFSLSSGG